MHATRQDLTSELTGLPTDSPRRAALQRSLDRLTLRSQMLDRLRRLQRLENEQPRFSRTLEANRQAEIRQEAASLRALLRRYQGSDTLITHLPSRADVAAVVRQAHDLGVEHGLQAAAAMGLHQTDFVNPFEHIGAYGQGFDDIMRDADGVLYIVEYKGGAATLSEGQMTSTWVLTNIDRLHAAGGNARVWAQELRTAWRQGRLRGMVFETRRGQSTLRTPMEFPLPPNLTPTAD